MKVANKYKLTDEQLAILGKVDDDFEKRAKALAKTMKTETVIQRDPNIGQRNTHSKVVTGNDWLRGVLDSMN